jgi:hypothetical protein
MQNLREIKYFASWKTHCKTYSFTSLILYPCKITWPQEWYHFWKCRRWWWERFSWWEPNQEICLVMWLCLKDQFWPNLDFWDWLHHRLAWTLTFFYFKDRIILS